MTSLEELTVGHVRVLRLNRPERKNALTAELGWRVIGAVRRADTDDDIRVIALTGNGDAFCSGLDLGPSDDDAVDTGLSEQQRILDDLGWVGRFLVTLRLDTDKPVVAGINGVAVGAGLSLAMCADIRIASDTARLHPGYLRAGTSPDGGLTWTLPTLVGHENAMRFLLESRFVDGTEAHARGLVGEVVPAAKLDDRLIEYCTQLSEQAPLGVRQTKRLVARSLLADSLETRAREEVALAVRGLNSEDGQEAVRAIMEKRSPEYKGPLVTDTLDLKDAVKRQPLTITVVKTGDLEVIGHQRKPRPAHLKALTSSIERVGFLTALVAVERDGKYVIIDGQHRFQAGVELGMKEFPVVVVPEKVARRMMNLNIEQSLNIRERCGIALAIYREMLGETPRRSEDHGEVTDVIEVAHLVTLGLAYERSGRLAGSAFEPILKKCDGFLDRPLEEAYEIRQGRADKVLEAAKKVKTVEDALKATGAWHSMARYQIISFANPTKRARKPSDFDKTIDKFISVLDDLAASPRKVLGEKVE